MRTANVYPDIGAVGDAGLAAVVGALLTIVLIVAVLMILVSAIAWAIAAGNGNYSSVAKAKAGLWVGIGAAALGGASVALLNWLVTLGAGL